MARFVVALVVMVMLPLGWATAADVEQSTNLKVRVTLRNGARFVGVVRDGALYEVKKADGRFRRVAGPREAGAGFRLWHVADSPGYLWVAHRDVKRFEQLSLMTSKELYAMQKNLRQRAGVIIIPQHRKKVEESEEGESGDAAKEEAQTPVIGPAPPPGMPEATEDPADEEEEEEKTPGELLLEKFDPADGWLPERRDEIERRKWVLGVFPTPEEKEFLENYPVWKEAYDAWLTELIQSRKQAEPVTKK